MNTAIASFMGGFAAGVFMTPLDVISTRLYNQGNHYIFLFQLKQISTQVTETVFFNKTFYFTKAHSSYF